MAGEGSFLEIVDRVIVVAVCSIKLGLQAVTLIGATVG